MKYLIVCLLFINCINIFATVTEKERLSLEELSREKLKNLLKKTSKELVKQKEEIVPTKIMMAALDLHKYCLHPFVEADTGYTKKWYQAMYSLVDKMSQVKSKQKVAIKIKNKKDYLQYQVAYQKFLNLFLNLVKKPQKVTPKELVLLRKAARRKRKEIEKRLEKEGVKLDTIKKTNNSEPDRRGAR